ncbi:soma ferritin [Dermacentor andersoni]|uniref:soma ferritin n=1 Tax=Dermacentor andersoni TaxID=34620 RepID=UPI0021553FEB|nr:soma ferritin [Dermacentor andersoni]QLM00666.1 ferritin 2 [Dermacentor andersoni]
MLRLALLIALASAARAGNNLNEQVNQNRYFLHDRCRIGLQEQVNLELHASLVYMQMAAHLANNKVARNGFARFFRDQSSEEREHAQKLIDYVNLRGGTVSAVNVDMPATATWMSVLDALQAALALEHRVTNRLHELHRLADDSQDPQMADFLEQEFLAEQVRSIDQLQRLITQLQNMDTGLGEFLLDQQLRA